MRRYQDKKTDDAGPQDVTVTEGSRSRLLDPAPSQRLWNHSPDGFSWGYHGSGPAQLALAILLDVTHDKEIAVRYHQAFKREFVASWQGSWAIDEEEIKRWLLIVSKVPIPAAGADR